MRYDAINAIYQLVLALVVVLQSIDSIHVRMIDRRDIAVLCLCYTMMIILLHSFMLSSLPPFLLACLVGSHRAHVGLLRAGAGVVSSSPSLQHHRHQQARPVLTSQGLGGRQRTDAEPHRGVGGLYWRGGGRGGRCT